MKDFTVSPAAKKVLETQFRHTHVLNVKEYLEHDGYDELGPESDLWTLCVYIEDHNVCSRHTFRRENWYTKDGCEPYYRQSVEILP